ncbi:MAG: tRNA (adenosine(37)-N6)-threonylcarbamoyltransferase complex dimerization subunit type 1 TsaB [Candidatus Sericytochromatia bacterium]
MLVLGINTCENGYLSVSISEDDKIIDSIEKYTKKTEETVNLIYELFKKLDLNPEQLISIGLITGPGGYTGIRAGLSVAKTMSQLLDIPLIGFSKAEAYIYSFNSNELVCPLIDVKRDEVYTCIGKINEDRIEYILEPCVIELNKISEILKNSNEKVLVLSSEILSLKDKNDFDINKIIVDLDFKINSQEICKITYDSLKKNKITKYYDILPIYAREAI